MATTKQTMTANDWLDLMEADGEELRTQGWYMDDDGVVRNRLGQCPMCALSELHGSRHYLTAAILATREAFGLDVAFDGVNDVMNVADNYPQVGGRARLLTILGVQA